MKSVFLVFAIALGAFFSSESIAFADKELKVGIDRLRWNVEGSKIALSSWHIQFEHYLKKKNVGIGLQFRKESELIYEGYYIGSYMAYKSPRRTYLFMNGGVEFGISSLTYNSYDTQFQRGYTWQRWVYLAEPSVKGVGIYPFAVTGFGVSAKHIVFEGGVKIQAMRFGVKEGLFSPNQSDAYSFRDGTHGELIPSAILQVGFKF